MFFSATDAKGRILEGNEAFARISGYVLKELIDQPHNIIRHPHMPRAAFAVLWGNLAAGRPFNGYVLNMAKDGTHYWVFATICPLRDGRLLSVRFKPTTRDIFGKIPDLYAQTLAAEKAVLTAGGTEKEATAAGVRFLGEAVTQLGYASYDEFSEMALNHEMISRDAQLEHEKLRLFPTAITATEDREVLEHSYRQTLAVYADAVELFKGVHRIGHLSHVLREEATSVINVADDFRLAALNTNIASTRFGTDGGCISVIASFLMNYATGMTSETDAVRGHLKTIADSTRAINASVAIARLQLEMILFFQAEIAEQADHAGLKLLPDLEEAFLIHALNASRAIEALAHALPPVSSSRDSLTQAVTSIQMAQVRGLTEAARLAEAESLRMMFEEFRAKTAKARTEIDRITEVLAEFARLMSPLGTRVARLQQPLLA
jgi:aerotaxis receptor